MLLSTFFTLASLVPFITAASVRTIKPNLPSVSTEGSHYKGNDFNSVIEAIWTYKSPDLPSNLTIDKGSYPIYITLGIGHQLYNCSATNAWT